MPAELVEMPFRLKRGSRPLTGNRKFAVVVSAANT